MAAGLLVCGTSSDAGKSLVITGLSRAWARQGLHVAPFKAQNMSNNSMVCRDGAEIGRAQYLQAQAARVEPSALHNPVLVKPGTDRQAFLVVDGRPAGTLLAGEYTTGRAHLRAAAFAAFDRLRADPGVDIVVAEGAGSPAEVNLRDGDFVNLGLAREFALPVVVVGDIDRGGLLAALYGTWALLDPADRALLRAFVVNKFRGDHAVLQPGLDRVSELTGVPFVGTLPWLPGVWLDSEDAISTGRWQARADAAAGRLSVAVVRFPRTSNATDVDPLAVEPGVDVRVTADLDTCRSAHLLVLPGSRATVADLAWLRERGLDRVVAERVAAGLPVLGICGGYQMLCAEIDDEVESGAGVVAGLAALPLRVEFGAEKVLGRPSAVWRGQAVSGYEIHHGVVAADGAFPGGTCRGTVWGTMWHGILESDGFRRTFLSGVAAAAGSRWVPDQSVTGFADRREAMVELLADAVEEHLDLPALLDLARTAGQRPA